MLYLRLIPLLGLVLPTSAWAGPWYIHTQESTVVGLSVAWRLGPLPEGASRQGVSLDVGWLVHGYDQRSRYVDEVFYLWAEEGISQVYGPVAHLWWQGGHWQASLGARVGLDWPLRVGIGHGWIPGPSLSVEVAPMLSTEGYVGLDLQLVAGLVWLEGRAALTLTDAGLRQRAHLGFFVPTRWPENWEDAPNVVWEDPEGSSRL